MTHTGSYMPQSNANQPPKPHARLEKWIWILIYGGPVSYTNLTLPTNRVQVKSRVLL